MIAVTQGVLTSGRVVRHGLITVIGPMLTWIIREDQGVLGFRVLKKVIDSLVLQQPGQEVEIRLAILHTILTRGIASRQSQLVVGEAVLFDDGFENLRDRHFLVDPTVGGPGEHPVPGPHTGAIAVITLQPLALGELAHQAVEVALLAIGQGARHGHLLAEKIVRVEIALLTQQIEVPHERLAQYFRTGHLAQQEHVLAKRCVELKLPRAHASDPSMTASLATSSRGPSQVAQPNQPLSPSVMGGISAGSRARRTCQDHSSLVYNRTRACKWPRPRAPGRKFTKSAIFSGPSTISKLN